MLGGLISDLEVGDELQPVRYTLTELMNSEYAHGAELQHALFYPPGVQGRQVRVPTLAHADKMRILEVSCPKERRIAGQRGPHARIHVAYEARHHRAAYVGEEFVVTGFVCDRYERRGREYLKIKFETRTSAGELVTEMWDTMVLNFRREASGDGA